MKNITELDSGDCFIFNSSLMILTKDFKKNGDRLCYNLKTGTNHWISGDSEVEVSTIYTLDSNNNIQPVK